MSQKEHIDHIIADIAEMSDLLKVVQTSQPSPLLLRLIREKSTRIHNEVLCLSEVDSTAQPVEEVTTKSAPATTVSATHAVEPANEPLVEAAASPVESVESQTEVIEEPAVESITEPAPAVEEAPVVEPTLESTPAEEELEMPAAEIEIAPLNEPAAEIVAETPAEAVEPQVEAAVEPVVEEAPVVETAEASASVAETLVVEETPAVEAARQTETTAVSKPTPKTPAYVAPKVTLADEVEHSLANGHLTFDQIIQRRMTTNLKRAMSLNDRFRFRRELFANNDELMNQSIEALEQCTSLTEATGYIADHFKWDNEAEVTVDFMALIEKRFA